MYEPRHYVDDPNGLRNTSQEEFNLFHGIDETPTKQPSTYIPIEQIPDQSPSPLDIAIMHQEQQGLLEDPVGIQTSVEEDIADVTNDYADWEDPWNTKEPFADDDTQESASPKCHCETLGSRKAVAVENLAFSCKRMGRRGRKRQK